MNKSFVVSSWQRESSYVRIRCILHKGIQRHATVLSTDMGAVECITENPHLFMHMETQIIVTPLPVKCYDAICPMHSSINFADKIINLIGSVFVACFEILKISEDVSILHSRGGNEHFV